MSVSSQSAAKPNLDCDSGGRPKPKTEPVGVLVADDNDMICDIVSMGLGAAGYTVTTANSGEEALRIFQTSPDSYPVVIVDDYMPGGMTGNEVIYHVRSIAPSAKVILTSGYFLSNQPAEPGDESIVRLEKPFRVEQLLKILKQSFG